MPGTYDIEHYRGDKYLGIKFQLFDENDVPFDLTGASVNMQLRKTKISSAVILEWSTTDNTIQVTGNEIFVKPRSGADMNIEQYDYKYDLEVTLSDGSIFTYIQGTFKITNDTTRPA